jgi:hypothetical protein
MSSPICPSVRHSDPVALIIQRSNGYSTNTATARWSVPIVDPRLWVHTGVLFVPTNLDTQTLWTAATTTTLWLSAAVAPFVSGGVRKEGPALPVQNLVGTQAAPLSIPADQHLFGKFLDFRSGADEIQGQLVVTDPLTEGTWFAMASYWPGIDMDKSEWEKLQAATLQIQCPTPQLVIFT